MKVPSEIDEPRGKVVEALLDPLHFLALPCDHYNRRVASGDVRIGLHHRLAKISEAPLPSGPREIRTECTPARTNPVTLPAASFSPEQLLAYRTVAFHWCVRSVLAQGLDIRNNAPQIVIVKVSSETRHLRSRNPARYHPKQVRIGITVGETPASQIGATSAAFCVESMAAAAGHPEQHASGFCRGRIPGVGVLSLTGAKANQRERPEKLEIHERRIPL